MIREGSGGWSLLRGTVCALCGAEARLHCGLCRGCRGDLPAAGPGCRRCALPLPGGVLCGHCQERPPPFQRAYAPFIYGAPVDALVCGAKYHQRLGDARVLGVLLAEFLADGRCARPDSVIPVPLHRRRLRERGYNQALEIARPAARALGVPIDTGCCLRTRPTSPQALLGGRERHRNIKGAFALARAPVGGHVAIVDDVMTTGGTVAEIAALLSRAGVARIDVWICARAPVLGP